MFINNEKGNLKLYDIKVDNSIKKLNKNLILKRPYTVDIKETEGNRVSPIYSDDFIFNIDDDKTTSICVDSKETDKYKDYFEETVHFYKSIFNKYYLTNTNIMINSLASGYERYQISALSYLNKLLKGNISFEDKKEFLECKKELLEMIKLVSYSSDYINNHEFDSSLRVYNEDFSSIKRYRSIYTKK